MIVRPGRRTGPPATGWGACLGIREKIAAHAITKRTGARSQGRGLADKHRSPGGVARRGLIFFARRRRPGLGGARGGSPVYSRRASLGLHHRASRRVLRHRLRVDGPSPSADPGGAPARSAPTRSRPARGGLVEARLTAGPDPDRGTPQTPRPVLDPGGSLGSPPVPWDGRTEWETPPAPPAAPSRARRVLLAGIAALVVLAMVVRFWPAGLPGVSAVPAAVADPTTVTVLAGT